MNVIDKAKELGELIASSDEMTALKKAEALMESDDVAKIMMNDYKMLQIEMVKANKEKRDVKEIDKIKDKLLAKQDEINNYGVTKDFIEAKYNLDKLMKSINDVIIFSISGEEPCSPNKCSSCSSNCSTK